MDAPQFDDLVRALVADAAERRSVLRRLLVGAVAGLRGSVARFDGARRGSVRKGRQEVQEGGGQVLRWRQMQGQVRMHREEMGLQGSVHPDDQMLPWRQVAVVARRG